MEIEPFNYSNDPIFNIGSSGEKMGMTLDEIIKETNKEKVKEKKAGRKPLKAVMQRTQNMNERKRLLVQSTSRRSQRIREQKIQANRAGRGDPVQHTQRVVGQINKILQDKNNQVVRTTGRFANSKNIRGRRNATITALTRQRVLRKPGVIIKQNNNSKKEEGKEVKVSFVNSKAKAGFKFNNNNPTTTTTNNTPTNNTPKNFISRSARLSSNTISNTFKRRPTIRSIGRLNNNNNNNNNYNNRNNVKEYTSPPSNQNVTRARAINQERASRVISLRRNMTTTNTTPSPSPATTVTRTLNQRFSQNRGGGTSAGITTRVGRRPIIRK